MTRSHVFRVPDGQRYLLDRFLRNSCNSPRAMTTTTGRAIAERRATFLRLYLQELQQELAEGGSGYDMPDDVTYCMLWGEKNAEGTLDTCEEGIKHVRVVPLQQGYNEQHSA